MLEPVVRELQVIVERMEARRDELLAETREKHGKVEAGVVRSGIGWVARRAEGEDVNLPVSLKSIDADLHLLGRLESEMGQTIGQMKHEIQESIEDENSEDLASLTDHVFGDAVTVLCRRENSSRAPDIIAINLWPINSMQCPPHTQTSFKQW